jgi:putative ABC transport system substrate-binding protein
LKRRNLFGLAAAALIVPPTLFAQQAERVRRIGILRTSKNYPDRYAALMEGLRELGWVEGRNLAIEWRDTDGNNELAQARAEELVKAGVELIVTNATQPTQAARRATTALPIVAVFGDPVATGLAQSLARPGGNVTGLSLVFDGITTKAFGLMFETLPKPSRVAFLANPGNPFHRIAAKELDAFAVRSNVTLLGLWARAPLEIDAAFAKAAAEQIQAMLVLVEPFLVGERKKIADIALKARLPTFANSGEFVDAGCLASYGADIKVGFRGMAKYVDSILKGAKPGELPIEQATRVELALNRTTARELGVTIPQTVLVRADRMID